MSALHPKADIDLQPSDVRYVPIADISIYRATQSHLVIRLVQGILPIRAHSVEYGLYARINRGECRRHGHDRSQHLFYRFYLLLKLFFVPRRLSECDDGASKYIDWPFCLISDGQRVENHACDEIAGNNRKQDTENILKRFLPLS